MVTVTVYFDDKSSFTIICDTALPLPDYKKVIYDQFKDGILRINEVNSGTHIININKVKHIRIC